MIRDVFCPVCNGPIATLQAATTRLRRHPVYGLSIAVSYPHIIACSTCSLVSEINSDTGKLIDLGNIYLGELGAPFVPGIDTPRVFVCAGTSSLWLRSDS